jgi:hypothetical protein
MRYWVLFWTAGILIAGFSFAFVTIVVTIKGGRDLREMFSRLRDQKDHDPGAR